MARVTVEDCIVKIPNRFELVLVAGQRARDVAAGASLSIDRDNDKNPVVALREIAEETIPLDALRDGLVRGLQKHVENDEPEEDADSVMEEMLASLGVSEAMLTGAAASEETEDEADPVEDTDSAEGMDAAVDGADAGDIAGEDERA